MKQNILKQEISIVKWRGRERGEKKREREREREGGEKENLSKLDKAPAFPLGCSFV